MQIIFIKEDNPLQEVIIGSTDGSKLLNIHIEFTYPLPLSILANNLPSVIKIWIRDGNSW